jgi:glycerol-3-phosphate acyltransferase PlsY
MVLYLTGFALMLGHEFPLWLRWRGGKGLACASGFLFQMWPYSVLAGLIVLLIARTLMHNFDLAFAVAAAAFFSLTFVEGNDLTGLVFVILFLGMAGAKKLLDLPHERAVLAKSSRPEEAVPDPETQHQHTQ